MQMFKASAEAKHYTERTASHATKGSPRGHVNIIGPEGWLALAQELEGHAKDVETKTKRNLKQIKGPLTDATMQLRFLCEMRDDFKIIGDSEAARQLNVEIRAISKVTKFLVEKREAIKEGRK